MLPAFKNRIVFTDHADASFYGAGPYEILDYTTEHDLFTIRGRDYLGYVTDRLCMGEIMRDGSMTIV